jgi:hypothetical protein
MENTHLPTPDSVGLSSGGQTPPPDRPSNTSAADPNPNPVLVLKRNHLEAELHAAYRRLDQSHEQWVTTLADRLVAAGNVNPWRKPFIVILDRAGEDPNEINSIALDRSTDWTVYHSIGITTSRLAKFGVACHFRQTAKDFLAPQLTRRLAQLGWAEAQSWYEFVVEAAWLEGQRDRPTGSAPNLCGALILGIRNQ